MLPWSIYAFFLSLPAAALFLSANIVQGGASSNIKNPNSNDDMLPWFPYAFSLIPTSRSVVPLAGFQVQVVEGEVVLEESDHHLKVVLHC